MEGCDESKKRFRDTDPASANKVKKPKQKESKILALQIRIIKFEIPFTFSQKLDESGGNSSQILAHFFVSGEEEIRPHPLLPTFQNMRNQRIVNRLVLPEKLRKV